MRAATRAPRSLRNSRRREQKGLGDGPSVDFELVGWKLEPARNRGALRLAVFGNQQRGRSSREMRAAQRSVNPPTYHLWFKPSGEAYKILRRTIEQLAQKLDAPMFEPHISLIGNLDGTEEEIIKKSESLAKSLKPFTAVLTEPAYRDSHFQCLFMLVNKAP